MSACAFAVSVCVMCVCECVCVCANLFHVYQTTAAYYNHAVITRWKGGEGGGGVGKL